MLCNIKELLYNIIYTLFSNKTTLVAKNYTPTTPTLLPYEKFARSFDVSDTNPSDSFSCFTTFDN